MANRSYYFTLFNKFQVLGHVPEKSDHGGSPPTGGFDLNDPSSSFGSVRRGRQLMNHAVERAKPAN